MKPKYILVSDWIRERILSGVYPNHAKLPSENEFVKKFNVSRQTVRQAINTLVCERFVQRRQGSGTYVCYHSDKDKVPTQTIGVITTYFNQNIFPDMINGIDRVLKEHDYHMDLKVTYNQVIRERLILKSMLENNVDGLIIEPTKSALLNPNCDLYREVIQRQIPIVLINGYYTAFDFPYVAMDDYTAGKQNTVYLIQRGHTKLFGIFKSDDMRGHFRYSGFINTLQQYQLKFDDDNILWYVTEDLEKLFCPSNDQSILQRIGENTGIVCYNDEVAVKLIEVFQRNQKSVPKDYSMIGFDNSNLSVLCDIGLTSSDYPAKLIGIEAANRVLKMLQGLSVKCLLIPPKIIQRNSVKDNMVRESCESIIKRK